MNAYELADELQKHGLNGDNYGLFNKRIQNMLRQQADRIAELEQNLSAYIVELELHKAMIQDLEKQSEPVAWMSPDGKVSQTEGKLFYIPLYTTPQTKPLSDEEIKAIAAQNRTDLSIPAYISFARAIEERHGIK